MYSDYVEFGKSSSYLAAYGGTQSAAPRDTPTEADRLAKRLSKVEQDNNRLQRANNGLTIERDCAEARAAYGTRRMDELKAELAAEKAGRADDAKTAFGWLTAYNKTWKERNDARESLADEQAKVQRLAATAMRLLEGMEALRKIHGCVAGVLKEV